MPDMLLRWVKYGFNSCESIVFSGQPLIVYFIRVCKIRSFRVSSLNCFKRSLLIGRLEITKCTWWIRLFSSNSAFPFLMYARLRACETIIIFQVSISNQIHIFANIEKNLWIQRGQLTMDLLKIDFNSWWSLITVNLLP